MRAKPVALQATPDVPDIPNRVVSKDEAQNVRDFPDPLGVRASATRRCGDVTLEPAGFSRRQPK